MSENTNKAAALTRKKILALKANLDSMESRGYLGQNQVGATMLTEAACDYPDDAANTVTWLLHVAEKLAETHCSLVVALASGYVPEQYHKALEAKGWKKS